MTQDSNAQLRDQLRERPALPVQWPASGTSKVLIGRPCLLCGYSLRESTGAAAATVELQSGQGAGGAIVAEVALASGGFDTEVMLDEGLLCEAGIYVSMVAGSVVGSFWVRR